MTEEDFYTNPYSFLSQQYPDAYIASWSAADAWGIIDELSRRVILFSLTIQEDKKINGIDVLIKKVPPSLFFDIVEKQEDAGTYKISSPTKTVLDCMAYPELAGGKRQVDYLFSIYKETKYYDEQALFCGAKKMLSPDKISALIKLIQRDAK